MIESSNGYRLRPLTYDDERFLAETLADFPLMPMSLAQARNELSNMLYVGRGFDEQAVRTGGSCSICMVLELNGQALGFRLNRFADRRAELAMLAFHPAHRGQKHQSADAFLHGWWYFDEMKLRLCWTEADDNDGVNGAAEKWRRKREDQETSRRSRFKGPDGKGKMLRRLEITPKAYRDLLAEHPTYSGVTFSRTA